MSKARNLATLLGSDGSVKTEKYVDSVGGQATFVASGVLPNGTAVILNSDGTVSAVTGSTGAESIPAGSATIFNTGNSQHLSVAFDPNNANKFVLTYSVQTSGNYGYSNVGTISGNSISFGAEVIFTSAAAVEITASFDPNTAGKFVVIWQEPSNASHYNSGAAVVGTVSGTSISYGTLSRFNSSYSGYVTGQSKQHMAFDPNTAGRFFVVYKDHGNSNYGTAKVGTVSGTSLTFSAAVVFDSTNKAGAHHTIAFDSNTANKFVVAYSDGSGSNYGTSGVAKVGTISGTSISFGAGVIFDSSYTRYNLVSFDSNAAGKFVIAYTEPNDFGSAIVGQISGTSISFGTKASFNTGTTYYPTVSFDPNTPNKFVVAYRDASNSNYGTAIVGTVSGTTISYGSESVFNTDKSDHNAIDFDPNTAGKFIVVYKDTDNSRRGVAILGQIETGTTNLTATNFIGIPDAAYADTVTATVTLPAGLSSNQSGLTAGSEYYVQGDGTLSTSVGTPSVLAGKALSATSILLKAY